MRFSFVWLTPSIAASVCCGSFSSASQLRICRVIGCRSMSVIRVRGLRVPSQPYLRVNGAIFCDSVGVTTVGKRLLKARTLRGFSQLHLAAGTSNTRPLISMVEHGRANLSVADLTAAAKTLGVSLDFLCGLTTDPTPARQLARELADSTTRVRDLEEQKAYVATADDGGDYVGISELAGAGGAAVVDHEPITGRVKFPREWLSRYGLAAGECRVIQVLREPMEPTLVHGCSILVNHASRRRRVGRIFVVRTDDGLVVKRAGKDRAGAWQLVTDNPNKQACPTAPWRDDAPVIAEVRWAARTFL